MAYASVIHVVAVNAARGVFSATSIPNASQVDIFINQIAGKMDAAMVRGGYVVPIPSGVASSALAELEFANSVGAAYMVEQAAQVGSKRDEFQSMWESAIKMLESGQLPGLPQTADSAHVRGDSSYPTAMFHRDMDL